MMHSPGQPNRSGPMGGPMSGMMGASGTKVRDFKGTVAKLIAYLGQYKTIVIVVFIFAIASTAANIAGPKLLGNATTKLFEGVMAQLSDTGEIDFDYIGRLVLLTVGLYLVSAAFSYAQGWLMANVSTNIAYRFRRDISEKINRMPLHYFDTTTHGEVLSCITNDVDTATRPSAKASHKSSPP